MNGYISEIIPGMEEDAFAVLTLRLGALADELLREAEETRKRNRGAMLQRHFVGSYDELARIIEQRGKREAQCLTETAHAVEGILSVCLRKRFQR